jgi:putative membrane protein
MMMYGDGGPGWGWILMIVTLAALMGVAALAGAAFYRHRADPARIPAKEIPTEEPYRILADRLARGEMDEAEYLDRVRRLHT